MYVTSIMNTLSNLQYKLSEKDFKELKYSCIIFLILAVIIYLNAFEDNTYTCKNILVNTYLYVLISLVIFNIMTMLLINYELHISFFEFLSKFNSITIFIGFILILLCLFFIFYMNHTNILVSHIILLLLITIFSLLTSLIYARLKQYNLYNKTFYSTLLLVIVLLLLFYFNQDLIKDYLSENNYYIILILLFVVILVEILYILLFGYKKTMTIVLSAVVIIIFGYFLLADTQKILEITEENCNKALLSCNNSINDENCNVDDFPSYPQKSFDIFHDIIIIFQKVSQIFLVSDN